MGGRPREASWQRRHADHCVLLATSLGRGCHLHPLAQWIADRVPELSAAGGSSLVGVLGDILGHQLAIGLAKRVEPVRRCRNVNKKDMKWNDTTPAKKVDPSKASGLDSDSRTDEDMDNVNSRLLNSFL